jgi:hypothetical protein
MVQALLDTQTAWCSVQDTFNKCSFPLEVKH